VYWNQRSHSTTPHARNSVSSRCVVEASPMYRPVARTIRSFVIGIAANVSLTSRLVLHAHAALEHDQMAGEIPELSCEVLEMILPLREEKLANGPVERPGMTSSR